MEERATGLILRIRPLTETSLIIHWLTPESGRIATVAKGARRPKSPFRGKLDLFFEADFSFQRSRRSELHHLREVVLRQTNELLRKEMTALQQASYCASLIEQTTETETPMPKIFQLMSDFLAHLSSQPPKEQNVFAFEMKLLDELGLKPDFSDAKLSSGSKQILQRFCEMDWNGISCFKLSEIQVTEIRRFLHDFLIFNLGKVPKTRSRE